MSLFGGDDNDSRSAASSHEDPPSPPSVQIPLPIIHTLEYPDNDLLLNRVEDDSDSEYVSDEESSRPNRFRGPQSTWRRYTALDRQIAASLDTSESSDLAAHLYNAHNLKRRARKPTEQLARLPSWHSKRAWLRKGEELQFIAPSGAVEEELVPQKHWTAWPLSWDRIQKLERSSTFVDFDDDDAWCIKGSESEDAGDSLRKETLALFMRLAKDKWHQRRLNGGWPEHVVDHGKASRGSRSRTVRPKTSHSVARDSDHTVSDVESDDADASCATLLADDEKAERIFQPSINSLLSRLDQLALGLRRNRLNHFGRGLRARSGTGLTSAAESMRAATNTPRRRAKSRIAQAKGRRAQPQSQVSSGSNGKQKRSVPVSATQSDSDSASDYQAERQKRKPSKNSPRAGFGPSSSSTAERSNKVGTMDWSEVLGIAAVTGWDARVVGRAAQRCAALFGEGMVLQKLDERHARKPTSETKHYTSTIPSLDDMGIATATATARSATRPYFRTSTARCPHKDCWGHDKEFRTPYRVVEHVMRVHGYDPRTNDSDNEERYNGGVHIDGFLEPIGARQLRRSKSRGPKPTTVRKKPKLSSAPSSPPGNTTYMEE